MSPEFVSGCQLSRQLTTTETTDYSMTLNSLLASPSGDLVAGVPATLFLRIEDIPYLVIRRLEVQSRLPV